MLWLADNATIHEGPSRADRLRGDLRTVILAWVYGACWMATINGAALTRFARELYMPDFAFGVLAALPHLGAMVQLPAAYMLERFGGRKRIFMVFIAFSRLLWCVVAIIPWVMPGSQKFWWPMMTAVITLSWVTHHVGVPAWMNWMADLVPGQVRGRFFARRARIGQIIIVCVTVAIGYIMDIAGQASEMPDLMLIVTSVIIAVGGLMGTLDILCYRKVLDPQAHNGERKPDWRAMLIQPLRNPHFRAYLGFNFTLMLAMGFVGQYIWLFAFDVIHMSNGQANLLLVAIPIGVMVASYGFWGALIDKLGKKPVIIICGILIANGTFGWLFITPDKIVFGYTISLLASFAWPGVELANFNILLGIARSSPQKQAGDSTAVASSAYVGVAAIATSVGGVMSGVLGGGMAAIFRDFHWELPELGIVFTYHSLLFALSAALRLLAVLFACRLAEPAATGTLDAVRYMSSMLYSNVRQTLLLPARVLQPLKSVYRIKP